MAKCCKMVGRDIPLRMSDDDAFQVVRDGDGQYCAKGLWKRTMANEHDPNYRFTGLAKLSERRIVEVDTLQTHAQRKRGSW